ncbi:MAG: hypothetical protein LBT88_01245 [Oscillospiraceae bacterium]|jgi:hypothetical protein|nr:hypothetical protein [Oscillospiraceae bacterium]
MLKGLLKEQIRSDPQIAGMLTSYGGEPAFFYQKSPPDTDRAWHKPCYPRADYNIDMRYDPERKTAGTLTVNVWCSSDSLSMPEDIEKRLTEIIDGTFYTSDGDSVCAVWSRSDAFDFEKNLTGNRSMPEGVGATIEFDLLSFPCQLTTDPDPIQGAHIWTRKYFPAIGIITQEYLPPIWKPTDETPAIYWRFAGISADNRQSYALNWYTAQIAAHIIADSVTERNRWLKSIVERMQLDGEIVLPNGAPMFINQVQVRHGADPLRDGQLQISGQYPVRAAHRKEHAENILRNANFNG